MSSYKIDRTVHVVLPVRIQCDTEESFAEHAKSLRPSIDYGGAGVRGGYSVKSGEPVVEPVYRVKGLVWENIRGSAFNASTIMGEYMINCYAMEGWVWWCHGQPETKASSLESAKAAAESHWKARIAACLEEVK